MTEADLIPSPDLGLAYPAQTQEQLWVHQLKAIGYTLSTWASGRPGVMLAMGMGSGKTRVALSLITTERLKHTVVFCPRAVAPVWVKQAARFAPDVLVCDLSEGSLKDRADRAEKFIKSEPGRPKIFITNYQSVVGGSIFASWLLWRSGRPYGWDLIVCDEAHKIKSPNGVTSKFLHKLGKRAFRRLALTGTPLPHSPMDAFSEYRFLDESIFGKFITAFRTQYCEMHPIFKKQVVGWLNQEEFTRKLGMIMHQCKTEEVLDLPEAVHQERFIQLTESAKAYQDIEREFITLLEDGREVTAQNVLVQLLRLQEITGGAIEQKLMWYEKANALRDFLDELPVDEPVVVFGRFHSDLDRIKEMALASNRGCCELSGREDSLEAWQRGAAPVLAAQISSGSLGVDLTRARYCVFYSLTFSLAEYDQALARIRRPGQQSKTCWYTHLVCRGTVDEKIYAALSRRKEVIDSFLERANR